MVTSFYPPYHFGGDGTYVRALSNALVERGHEVTVIHCEDSYRLSNRKPHVDDLSSNVKVHRLRSRFGFLSPLLTQQTGFPVLKHSALKTILAEDFDVVNFHNISLVGGPGVIRLSQAKVNIYTLHEHWLICPTHILWKDGKKACDQRQCVRCCLKSGIPPQWWRYSSLIENSIDKIDCFISPSHFTAEQHKKNGITKTIKVLPLFSHLSPDEYSDKSQGEMSFITVGRITASKGVADLIKSFSLWPHFKLRVVGDGDLLDELQLQYKGCKNIEFIGQVTQESLKELYCQSTALILPSLAPETFGLTIVEAFSCGVPAIVRIAGGNREMVDISQAGFLYNNETELKFAVEQFSTDSDLRSRLGLKARKAYEEHYTEKKHVDSYLDIVAGLIKNQQVTMGNG